MVQEKRHVIVVCGYGCHLDTPLGWVYLPRVKRFISEQIPDLVVLCGGYTQRKSAPGISEARLMFNWLRKEMTVPNSTKFHLEEDSYTTIYNLENAALWMGNWFIHRGIFGNEKVKITIFCEATRSANVVMIARDLMGDLVESIDDITVETASWERADPFKQVINLIHSKLALKYPRLRFAEREHRKRIRRAEQI